MKKILSITLLLSMLFLGSCQKNDEPSFSDFQIYTVNETDYGIIITALDGDGDRLGAMQSMPHSTNIGRFYGASKVLLDIEWHKQVNGQWVKIGSATARINNPNRDYTIKFAGDDYMLQ